MPTYEYVCKKCGETIEIFQSFSDRPLKKHKVCGGDLQKVFHSRGIVFKGDGFYATESRAAAKSSKDKSDKSDMSDKSDRSDRSDKSDKSDKKGSKPVEKTTAKAGSAKSSTDGD